ncbi:hypothetical protein ACFE04_026915 [Oxalis oulophora]
MGMQDGYHVDNGTWYFSKEEIQRNSPSRKDGISLSKESQLRESYCFYLKELGIKLRLPQVTIACAMMMCHRFYMRQSLAKNDWKTMATVSLFLAGKIKETPRLLKDIIVVAHEMICNGDPLAIRQKDVYYKQKELILVGERLLMATIAFDFNIELPYNSLVTALKKLDLSKVLLKESWNFLNDWLCTTLCLQYEPRYIAAGTVFLVAKFKKVRLPTGKDKSWWHEFDIDPKQLEVVTRDLLRWSVEWDKKRVESKALVQEPIVETKEIVKSPDTVIGNVKLVGSQTSDSDACSGVEDPEAKAPCVLSHVDSKRIKEALKRKRCNADINKKVVTDELDDEAWIERELENGIIMESDNSSKKQKNAT